MKIKMELYFLILIFFTLLTNINSKIVCAADKYVPKFELNKLNKTSKENTTKRKISSEDDYKSIRIYLSLDNIRKRIEGISAFTEFNIELLNKIFLYLNNTISYVEKLIKVNRRANAIIISEQEQRNDLSISEVDETLISGVNADLVLIPTYIFEGNEIYFENYKRDEETYRVIISKLNIPLSYMNNALLTQVEAETILLHEITHILGFHYEHYQYFPGGINKVINKTIDKNGKNIYYIITPKVVELAKKYFNCDALFGLQLENQDNNNNNIPSSHWESRILLGEYMNLELYSPEIVISDFTLALLEDSGWYKVNYYTGGLMRFGKNRGCEFLNFNCLDENKETKYKNEFFGINDINNPSCSAGRLSRTYCLTKTYNNNLFSDIGGLYENADYCFTFYYEQEEENIQKYIGSCRRGKGEYGSNIEYKDINNKVIKINNGLLESDLGEVYSDKSFCVLSEVYNINNLYNNNLLLNLKGIIHPICYEMFCSDYSLTIKIKEEYIVCPRQGGKIKIYNNTKFNLSGYLYCPDYNLICTGSIICNDMFDCIKKESKSLLINYTYEFNESSNNQKISELKDSNVIEGYELDKNKGICPLNCAQCDSNKKCTKCRNGFNIIVQMQLDNSITICDNNIININKGYYLYDNAYYPCLDFCDKCDDSITCNKCDELHKLNNNKTICYDLIENCDEYNDNDFSCSKCINGYAFLKEERRQCRNDIILNIQNYFSLDEGISYYPCDTNIKNCEQCDNKYNYCSKCKNGFYLLNDNRTFCFSEINLTKYYTIDNGISYVLCNKTITNCALCNISDEYDFIPIKCTLCEKNFYFFENQRDKCYNNLPLDEYYTEDDGISYFSCNSNYFPNCAKCLNNKTRCEKCIKDYYFINDNKTKCEYISNNEINKYFSENGNISYYLCEEYLSGCEQCINRNICTKCLNNFYFLKEIKNQCFNLNLSHYFKQGDSYYPCNSSIENCDICNNKSVCELCNKDYYFIENDRSQCVTGKNLDKYYSLNDGISYILCNNTLQNCDECDNDKICNKCFSNFFYINNDRSKCFLEKDIIINNTYYKYNETFYRKCSENILFCEKCFNSNECDTCFTNYFFIDDDKTKCISIKNIDTEKYYLKDKYNYYKCNRLISNCENCNGTHCLLCENNFTLVNNNYFKCFPKINYQNGFYLDQEKNMYLPCIENCDVCNNDIECIKCKNNFTIFGQGTYCGKCYSFVININDELSEDTINNLILEYINDYNGEYDIAILYYNNYLNYQIVIYRAYHCTELFLKEKFFELNTKELEETLHKKYNDKINDFIYYMVIDNYKSYFGIYDLNTDKKYEIENECATCVRSEYQIKNNYLIKSDNLLGNFLSKKVNEYDLNILDSSDSYFNDVCYNMNFANIDIPLEQRRNIFYIGDFLTKLACFGDECDIINISYENNLANCKCKFNFNFTNKNEIFALNNSKNKNEFFDTVSESNPFPIFTCYKEAFDKKNIKSNKGFIIGIILVIIQLIFFLVLIINLLIRKRFIKNLDNNMKETIASPPIKDLLLLKQKFSSKADKEKKIQEKDKDDSSSDNSNIYNDKADKEKKIQEKDLDEDFEEEENFFDINSEINVNLNLDESISEMNEINNNNINKNNLTQLLSEENSLDISDNKNKTGIFLTNKKNSKLNFEFENINSDKLSNNNGGNLKTNSNKKNKKSIDIYKNNKNNKKNSANKNKNKITDYSKDSSKIIIDNNIEENNLINIPKILSKSTSGNKIKEQKNNLKNSNNPLIEENKEIKEEKLRSPNKSKNNKNKNINKNSDIKLVNNYTSNKKEKNSKDNLKNSLKNSDILLLNLKKNKNRNKNNKTDHSRNQSDSLIAKKKIKDKNNIINISRNTKDKFNNNNNIDDNLNSSNNLNYITTQNRKETLNNQEEIDQDNNKSNFSKKNSLKSESKSSFISNSEEDEINIDNINPSMNKLKKRLQYDFIPLIEARKNDKRKFWDIYCHLLTLKQPILDLISDIDSLGLNKSLVPFAIKVIRFLFILSLNLFLNSLFLTQKYFKKKYNFFNDKYHLELSEENYGKINNKEIFIYSIKHCFVFSIVCFIIIIFVQFLINYYFFNLRKKVWFILKKSDNKKNEEIKAINLFFLKYNIYYIIFASVNFIFVLIFFFYLINFSQAYKGGYIDYLTAAFLTWILLQVFPFITVLISTCFRYYGIKKGYKKLYKLNQVYAF